MASSRSALFSKLSAPTLVASLPLVIWARDNIVSLVRVQGASMEPTLQQGDVVLVRKADGGIFPRLFQSIVFGRPAPGEDGDDALLHHHGVHDEYTPLARLYEQPPHVRRGQVVVVKSVDTAFPDEWHMKRLWGTPGTWVKVDSTRGHTDPRRVHRKLQAVPAFSLYVGGDNPDLSRDSRHYGPVSQNLLVGVAEYVVWPPSRIQKIATDMSVSDYTVPNKDMRHVGRMPPRA